MVAAKDCVSTTQNKRKRFACDTVCCSRRSSSPKSVARLICVWVPIFLISLWWLPLPEYAVAATWPVPASTLSASVAFHETYSAGASSYVHSGIDIPASAGSQILVPAAGTVRFTGNVPSGDSRVGAGASQKTMRAVSVELPDSRVVTLMPFLDVCVAAGDWVDEGAALGTLAVSGDPSSAEPHLHVGLKRGRAYIDPMSLFGVEAQSEKDESVSAEEAAAVSGAAPRVVAPESAASVSAPAQAPAAELESVQESASAPGGLSPDTAEAPAAWRVPETKSRDAVQDDERAIQPNSVSSGEVSWEPQPQNEIAFGEIRSAALPLLEACSVQLRCLRGALLSVANAIDIPAALLEAMVALAAVALLGAVLYSRRRLAQAFTTLRCSLKKMLLFRA